MLVRLSCTNCRTPFTLKNEQVHLALDEMHENNFKHHNTNCPSCGKLVRVDKKKLRRSAPDWTPSKKAKAKTEQKKP